MKGFLLFATIWLAFVSSAQDTTYSSVIIHKDPRIDLLIKKESEINLANRRAAARSAHGYRLMIVSTNNRNEAIEAKTKIYTYFPELKSYLIYQSPFFKLKAGNFRTHDEADRFAKELSPYFPKGIFVINDIIEIRPEKESEE